MVDSCSNKQNNNHNNNNNDDDDNTYKLILKRFTFAYVLNMMSYFIRSLVIAGIAKTLTVMDQLIVGMQTFHFLLEYMKKNEKLMQPIFTVEGKKTFKPTSDIVLGALKPEFSDDGSNLKAEEIDIHKNFCDYVQDLEETDGENMNKCTSLYYFINASKPF
jgi:hypothetical protein